MARSAVKVKSLAVSLAAECLPSQPVIFGRIHGVIQASAQKKAVNQSRGLGEVPARINEQERSVEIGPPCGKHLQEPKLPRRVGLFRQLQGFVRLWKNLRFIELDSNPCGVEFLGSLCQPGAE